MVSKVLSKETKESGTADYVDLTEGMRGKRAFEKKKDNHRDEEDSSLRFTCNSNSHGLHKDFIESAISPFLHKEMYAESALCFLLKHHGQWVTIIEAMRTVCIEEQGKTRRLKQTKRNVISNSFISITSLSPL